MLTNNFVGHLNYVILCFRWCACSCYSNENNNDVRAIFKACASHEIKFCSKHTDHELHSTGEAMLHDDVIKWKHFPRYWPFVWRIHRSRMNSPHKGRWRGALMFSMICVWINGWKNNRGACDWDAIVLTMTSLKWCYDIRDLPATKPTYFVQLLSHP